MDLDLATDINHLHDVIRHLVYQGYDITYGSRLLKGSQVIGRKFIREITSRALSKILKAYTNTKIIDTTCGFKFLKSTRLKQLIKNGSTSDKWFFHTELLLVAEAMNLKLKAIPVKWVDDPNSKVKIFKLACEYLKAMKVLKPKIIKLRNNQP